MREMRPSTMLILMVLMGILVAPLMFMDKIEPERRPKFDDIRPILPPMPQRQPHPTPEPDPEPEESADPPPAVE